MDQSGAKQEKLADRGNGAQPVRTGAQKGGILAEGGALNQSPRAGQLGDYTAPWQRVEQPIYLGPGRTCP